MSFKVDALNAIGGFDEEFKGTARREESDICMRLMEKFHKNCIVFSPDATLVHNMAVSGGCRASKDKRADYIRNEFFFLDKHVKNLLWRAIAKGLTWLKVFMLD
jgi:GT2 family glycosyltransferase